jgi:hypothetical protein
MRFPIVLGAVAALLSAFPALAFDTPRALVDGIYQPYLAGQQQGDPSQFYSSRLKTLFATQAAEQMTAEVEVTGSIGSATAVGFNPFIDGEHGHIVDIAIGEPVVLGEQALVTVAFNNFDQPTLLSLSLVREADGWKVDDVTSTGGEENWMLSWLLQYDPWSM